MEDERRVLRQFRKIPLFQHLSSEKLERLIKFVQIEQGRRRHLFFMKGDPGNSIYFVSAGRVKISRITPDGKELTIAYRGVGESFGELCLEDGTPRQDMAEAMENTTAVVIPRERFEKLLQSQVDLAYNFCRMLCLDRRELELRFENVVFKDVNTKIAELLLSLSVERGVEVENGILLDVKITHQEMANLIGSTRETVSLTLAQFKRSGLIRFEGRKIVIRDRERLQALV
ncbi:MAG: Crp/Fnr family transcriptional regulator [Pseudomonadota bacterium]